MNQEKQMILLSKTVEEQAMQIKILEEFVLLFSKRDEIAENLGELQDKISETSKKLIHVKQIVYNYFNNSLKQYENVIKKIRMQRLTTINILMELKKSRNCVPKSVQKGVASLAIHKSLGPFSAIKQGNDTDKNPQCETPKMYLYDYLASPYTRKVRPIPFQFLDFEHNITSEMFETIPKYMRGRETVDELKSFFDKIIVATFNEKYQLLHRQRDSVRNLHDIELWRTFQNQSSYFPGQKFITEEDLCRRNNKMLDKKSKNRITMLKHLAILQEQRNGKTICYVWIAS